MIILELERLIMKDSPKMIFIFLVVLAFSFIYAHYEEKDKIIGKDKKM